MAEKEHDFVAKEEVCHGITIKVQRGKYFLRKENIFLAAMSTLPRLYIMRLTLAYYPDCLPLSLQFLTPKLAAVRILVVSVRINTQLVEQTFGHIVSYKM